MRGFRCADKFFLSMPLYLYIFKLIHKRLVQALLPVKDHFYGRAFLILEPRTPHIDYKLTYVMTLTLSVLAAAASPPFHLPHHLDLAPWL